MPHGWIKVPRDLSLGPAPIKVYEPKKTLPKGHWTYSLELQTTKALGPRSELDEYIQTIKGAVIAEEGRLSSVVKEIGQLEVDIIQIRRIRDAGHSLSEICEEHSAQLMHLYQALYDVYAGWRVPDSEDFDLRNGSLYLIRNVRLDRHWRGNGIGLLAVEGLLRSCFEFNHDVAVLRPRASERAERESDKRPMERLREHWELLGFEPCAVKTGEDGVVEDMYMSLSEMGNTRLKQVVPHLFPRRRK